MKYPHIKSVEVKNNYNLKVIFDNDEIKIYDVAPLLSKSMFLPLTKTSFFKNIKIEKGGYAVSWNQDIDISEYELWKNGKSL